MVKAYILVEMLAGHSRNLVDTLRQRKSVKNVDRVTGPYDVMVVLEADDLDQVSDIVATELHAHPGVVRTTTCVCITP